VTDIRLDEERVARRLKEAGVLVEDLYSSDRGPTARARAEPALRELFEEVDSHAMRSRIVRLLSHGQTSVRWFLAKLEGLIREPSPPDAVLSEPDAIVGWDLAAALSTKADESVFSRVAELIRDKRLGNSRQMLAFAVARVTKRRAEAVELLLGLLDDPDMVIHAADALARMRATEAIPRLKGLAESHVPYARRSIEKALRKLTRIDVQVRTGGASDSRFRRPRVSLGTLSETSANLDLPEVRQLLAQIARQVGGIDPQEVAKIASWVEDLEPEEEGAWEVLRSPASTFTRLVIRAHMADIDAPSLYFHSDPDTVARIEGIIGAPRDPNGKERHR